MKDAGYEALREAGWRRELTPAEEERLRAWMAEHPAATTEWESERELTEALVRLPNIPVASNFTARVLQQARLEAGKPIASAGWWSWRGHLRWLPRMALATVVLAAGLISYQHTLNSRRQERADSVREIVSFSAFPGPEILADFDAIQAMSQSPAADVELLRALQ